MILIFFFDYPHRTHVIVIIALVPYGLMDGGGGRRCFWYFYYLLIFCSHKLFLSQLSRQIPQKYIVVIAKKYIRHIHGRVKAYVV